MFTNIIVAVDGSEPAKHALKVACDVAKQYDADIHIVHAPHLDTPAVAVGPSVYAAAPKEADIQKAGKQVVDESKSACTAMGCTPKSITLGAGVPASEVLKASKVHAADLIVCGRRGLGNLAGLVLGSTSNRIAHDADCAVLTVK